MSPVKNNRRGFTLTELAIVLSIVGLILGAIWGASSKVYANQKATKAVQEVLTIAQGIKGIYANKPVIDNGDLTAFASSAAVFAPDMLHASACSNFTPAGAPDGTLSPCPLSPWSTVMTVGGQAWPTCGGTTCTVSTFSITFWGLTNDQCAPLAAALIGNATNGGLVGFYYDSGSGAGPHDISSATPITSFSTCAGNVVLEFKL